MPDDTMTTGTLGTDAIEQLRKDISGEVITAGDADYDKARSIFPGGFDRRPQVVVRPANAADVARVVRLATETGQLLSVRSGGHSEFAVCDGGIALDVSLLQEIDIDRDSGTAWVGSGVTARKFTEAGTSNGLITGLGDTGSVGLGGIATGGGVGYLVRKYGLTIDDMIAAEIVTADGAVLQVDDERHPDLFWAIRGGGGNFGVVTRFRFQMHPIEDVVGGILILSATPEVIAGFIAAAEAAPEDLSTIVNIMTAPPVPFIPAEHHGTTLIMAMMVWAGDAAGADAAFAPFRALVTPIVDMIRPMSYSEVYPPDMEGYHPIAEARTMFLDRVDVDTATVILDRLKASTASMAATQLRVVGGAMARVPAEATAFAHRDRRIIVNLAAVFEDPADAPQHRAWVTEFRSAISQDEGGAYVNFLNDKDSAERIREAYPPATWERLTKIKAKYDPANVFRFNHNIPPATTG